MTKKLLFWLNSAFYHFSLAYYLQKKINGDFYGIVDINSKPKKFFENQKFVDFKKIWFYHDLIKKSKQNVDLEYLMNFENNYKINLSELMLNERFFHKFNRFYDFKIDEILLILEQEIKLFEKILDEIKPDFFLTYNPVLHHQRLLVAICRRKKIKVLNACRLGIGDQTSLVEDGGTFDLDFNKSLDDYLEKSTTKKLEKSDYDLDQKIWIEKRNVTFLDKLKAMKDFLLTEDSELRKSNYTYYGRTKLKVIKDALSIEIQKRQNYNFLNKQSLSCPNLERKYVYLPMNVVEESNLLHYASYYTNQVEVIRHIAKSIPVDHILYVKEHIAARVRFWNSIDTYKEISDIPNVKLIHPNFDNNELIKNSRLVIAVRGTSVLKAVKFGKPSITFGIQPYQIIPSVFNVTSLDSLPQLINESLNCKVNKSDYEKFEKIFDSKSFEFKANVFEIVRNQTLFSGNGAYSNVIISNKQMESFLKKNESLFHDSVNFHAKTILSNQGIS